MVDEPMQMANSAENVSRLRVDDASTLEVTSTQLQANPRGAPGALIIDPLVAAQQYKSYMMKVNEQLREGIKLGLQQGSSQSKVLPGFETRLVSQQQLL